MSRPDLSVVVDILEHLQRRVVQDAVTAATAETWRRRAEQFRAAAPQSGDFHGQSTETEIDERRRRCYELADLCESKAALMANESTWPPVRTCPDCMTQTSPWTCSCGNTRVGGAAS